MKTFTIVLLNIIISFNLYAATEMAKNFRCIDDQGDNQGSRLTVLVQLNHPVNMLSDYDLYSLKGDVSLLYRSDIAASVLKTGLNFEKEIAYFANELSATWTSESSVDTSRISIFPIGEELKKKYGTEKNYRAELFDASFGDFGLELVYYIKGDRYSMDSVKVPALLCDIVSDKEIEESKKSL